VDTDEAITTAAHIRLLSFIISKLARQELEQRMEIAGIALKATQYWVLRLLRTHERTLADLSRRLGLDASTLVAVVDSLERKGLIQRVPDLRDRRRTPIKLTSAGSELLDQISQLDSESVLVRSLHHMGDGQGQQLLHLLSQFVMHLSDDEELLALCRSLLQGVPIEE
jgi:DNA-binding MarR family transcriptional regulator